MAPRHGGGVDQVVRPSARYRVVWQGACALLAIVGVCVAGVRTPVALVSTSVAFATVGVVWTVMVALARPTERPRISVRHLFLSVLIWASLAGAVVGFVVLLGAAALLLGLAVLASSPYGIRSGSRWLNSMPTPSAAQVGMWSVALRCAHPAYVALEPPPDLSELTDEQLCDEWRSSYLALQRRLSHRQVMAIVRERQDYLDEFERRNPGGVKAWLASGAWASSTPLPYLAESRSDNPVINWDQLMRDQGW